MDCCVCFLYSSLTKIMTITFPFLMQQTSTLQREYATCVGDQYSLLLVPDMELILPEGAFIISHCFLSFTKCSSLWSCSSSNNNIYIFIGNTPTLTPKNLQQDTAGIHFSSGAGDKIGNNIWQMWFAYRKVLRQYW